MAKITNADKVIASKILKRRLNELLENVYYTLDSINQGLRQRGSSHAEVAELYLDLQDEAAELRSLRALKAQLSNSTAAQVTGGTDLIREDYVYAYFNALPSEIPADPRDEVWFKLRTDYMAVDFGGVTYWVKR